MHNHLKYFTGIIFLVTFFFLPIGIFSQTTTTQDNPLLILHTSTPPTIDGIGNDKCWEIARWQSIGEGWVPYGSSVSPSDYTGRYKVMWSSTTNLLYLLIEVTDDVNVGGYTAKNGTCYNYDISEVFIDENRSGGEHWTTNATNAFSYHMYCDYPADGQVKTTPYIEDMSGSSKWVEYTSHFPEFALRKNGNIYTREFSLIVYNDTYTELNKDAARVKLTIGKEMGLSVAYCDNDNPTEVNKSRDNMFGSVKEKSPGNNHYHSADEYGKVILTNDLGTGINYEKNLPTTFSLEQNYPNPFNPTTTISYRISKAGLITLKVFDLLGKEVVTLINEYQQPGNYTVDFSAQPSMVSGIYFYQLSQDDFILTKKMQLLK